MYVVGKKGNRSRVRSTHPHSWGKGTRANLGPSAWSSLLVIYLLLVFCTAYILVVRCQMVTPRTYVDSYSCVYIVKLIYSLKRGDEKNRKEGERN